jgi:hypothetical protein
MFRIFFRVNYILPLLLKYRVALRETQCSSEDTLHNESELYTRADNRRRADGDCTG